MVDKGWIASLDCFAECVASGTPAENATPDDALKVFLIAQAAARSRESGGVVRP
jgi:predicted dehydrogenase